MKIVILIIVWAMQGEYSTHGPVLHVETFGMPDGTTLEQCEAEHRPATDSASTDMILMSVKCVEMELHGASRT